MGTQGYTSKTAFSSGSYLEGWHIQCQRDVLYFTGIPYLFSINSKIFRSYLLLRLYFKDAHGTSIYQSSIILIIVKTDNKWNKIGNDYIDKTSIRLMSDTIKNPK